VGSLTYGKFAMVGVVVCASSRVFTQTLKCPGISNLRVPDRGKVLETDLFFNNTGSVLEFRLTSGRMFDIVIFILLYNIYSAAVNTVHINDMQLCICHLLINAVHKY